MGKRGNASRAVYCLCPRRAILMSRFAKLGESVRSRFSSMHQFVINELCVEGSDSRLNVTRSVCSRCFWWFKSGSDDSDRFLFDVKEVVDQHYSLRDDPDWFQAGEYYDSKTAEEIWETPEGQAVICLAGVAFDELVAHKVIIQVPRFGVRTETDPEAELQEEPVAPILKNSTPTEGLLAEKLAQRGVKRVRTNDLVYETKRRKTSSNIIKKELKEDLLDEKEEDTNEWYCCNWNNFLQSYRGEVVADYWASILETTSDDKGIIQRKQHGARVIINAACQLAIHKVSIPFEEFQLLIV